MPMSDFHKNIRAKLGPDLLLLPAVNALVFNDAGEILLNLRSDNRRWSVIGGMMDPHEQPATAVVREVLEETGIHVQIERITGVYLTRVIRYADGNAAQYVVTVFRCRAISGTPHVADDESLEVRFFPLDALPEISAEHRARIQHALSDLPPFFAAPGTPEPPPSSPWH